MMVDIALGERNGADAIRASDAAPTESGLRS
jgi:hypothetical protein